MSEPDEGSGRKCDRVDAERSTRRTFLTVLSFLGLDLAADAIPAWAEPASERPKEGDVLVAIDAEKPVALEAKDIPVGGPPVLAWPMDPASNTVRRDSRLNKVLLVHLEPDQRPPGARRRHRRTALRRGRLGTKRQRACGDARDQRAASERIRMRFVGCHDVPPSRASVAALRFGRDHSIEIKCR